MPDLTQAGFVTHNPGYYSYTLVGTAAGTTTIQSESTLFKGIVIPNRVASGSLAIYDSIGTSTSVIGTIVLGTQTNTDPPPMYEFNIATNTALTVVNSANLGAIVLYK